MKSIGQHLVLRLMIGTALLLVLTSVALYFYSRAFLVKEFDAALRSKALALVTLTEESDGRVELNFADQFMPEFERPDRPEYFQVWLGNGRVLERSRSLRGQDLPRRSSGSVTLPAYWDLALPDGRDGRAVGIQFAPQRADDAPAAASTQTGALLVVARERTALDHILAAFRLALNLFAAALLASMAVMVTIVVRRGLTPLGEVAERAAGIDASSLQSRFPLAGLPKELSPICQRLNDLLARLEEAFQRERRISADIAHELNTPLTELRAMIEVALKWPEDPDGTAATFRNALAVVQNMERMVTGLLALARTEDGKLVIQGESVAMAQAVEEIWQPLRAPAQRKQLQVAVNIPGTFLLHTDPTLLRHILGNLLHNAVDHSPAGGTIRIQATSNHAQFDLSVENTTNNLSTEDLPRLFERFWRKDPARTNSGHTGLGLTLARTVAEVLGMSLTAEIPADGLLRLALRGPLKAAPVALTRSADSSDALFQTK